MATELYDKNTVY